MSEYYPFIVFGIVSGSVYGLSALGLVLTYKTSGIFNFGQGGVTAVAAFTFYSLRHHGVPAVVAVPLIVVVFGGLSGLVLEVLARLASRVSTADRVVATIGLLILCQSGIVEVYGSSQITFPSFLPTHDFRVGSVNITLDQIITVAVTLIAAGGLSLFFRASRLGTLMRAVVDDDELLDISGGDPVRTRRLAWIVGSMFAAASGLLIGPTTGLDSVLLTLLVFQAFAAAATGAFVSLPLAYVGGIVVGLLTSLLPHAVGNSTLLQGLPLTSPFLLLYILLLVIPRARLHEIGQAALQVRALTRQAPLGQAAIGAGAGLVFLLLVPAFAGTKLPIWSSALTYLILFLSLSFLVRLSGQVSLCHIAFQAIGAAMFTHLTTLPWLLAVLVAAACAIPLGLLAAIPAMRLPGLFLAVSTLALGITLQYMGYSNSFMFGGVTGRQAPRPHIAKLDSDKGYYFVLLAFVVVTALFVMVVERSRLGRLLRGLADSPVAMATLGAGTNSLRVLVFCISAFIAAMSGALIGPLYQVIDSSQFSFLNSLIVLAVLVIAGRGAILAPVIAAVLIEVVPGYFTSSSLATLLPVLFGLGAMVRAVLPAIALPAVPTTPESGRPRRPASDRPGPLTSRLRASAPVPTLEGS